MRNAVREYQELKNYFGTRSFKMSEVKSYLKSLHGQEWDIYSALWNMLKKHRKDNEQKYNFSYNRENETYPEVDSYIIENYDSNQTFGVELEFGSKLSGSEMNRKLKNLGLTVCGEGRVYSAHGRAISYTVWNVTYDMSIHVDGFEHQIEIVSPILSGKSGMRDLCKVMDMLKNLERNGQVKVNKSCGTHVHFGKSRISGYNEWQGMEFFKFYALNETLLDSVLPVSRRNNNYSKTLIGNGINEFDYTAMNSDRYLKVNMTLIRTRGTIEVRSHSGTVDFEKIGNWLLLMTAMLKRSTNLMSEVKKFSNLDTMIRDLGLNETTRNFFMNRASELSGVDAIENVA